MATDTAQQLFASLADAGAMIGSLAADSRRCAPGVAFFAYPGESADGRSHIGEAIARGASAVLWEKQDFAWRAEWRVPNAPVRELRQQAGWLAHEFYGRPSLELWTCGVTGTNGKTSCSQWLAALLSERGLKTGVIGTLGSGFPGALSAGVNTTPDALEVHGLLQRMRDDGARGAAMEVSSHALAQGRVNGVRFACALFTNLSHDHLDYHRTMEAYGEAKARLFAMPGLGAAVINLDDPFGAQLAAKSRVRTIGYSLSSRGKGEYLRAVAVDGQSVQIESSWGRAEAQIAALGRFNVANALGVLGCLVVQGVDFREAAAMLARLPLVPGRMECIGDRPLVVVDYAHTPDALEKALTALRPVADEHRGALVVVFGAGGDRDATKRPLMGAVAQRLADRSLATSDNPRSEDPLKILREIGAAESEVDRGRAIDKAIREAAPNDVILIAGKGHETIQEIGRTRLPFSDQQAAREALARRGGQ